MTMNADDPDLVSLSEEIRINPDFAMFMLDMPIAVKRCYIPLTGRVTAALLLSWAAQISEELPPGDQWFAKSNDEWMNEIGLSKDELASARARLEELDLLHVRREVIEPGSLKRVNHYRVNWTALTRLLLQHGRQMRLTKSLH